MRRVDRDGSRFKRSLKRLSQANQAAVDLAIAAFLKDPIPPGLDFKQRKGSQYYSLRAGTKPGNLRIVLLRDALDPDLYRIVFVGNHDDLNSLDRQGR